MAQDWDDILSEPIAQLQPDRPAADGGWRAVRSLDEVSPRPQQPPSTMKAGESFLSLKPPVQSEDDEPASTKPPPSLTEQLSLTWANRRARARATAEVDEVLPREPAPAQSEPSPRPAKAPIAWLQPLKRVMSRLQGKPQPVGAPQSTMVRNEAPSTPTPARRLPVTETTPAGRSTPQRRETPPAPSAVPEPTPEVESDAPAVEGPKSLPLTLAQPRRIESTRAAPEEAPAAVVKPAITAQEPTAAKRPRYEAMASEPSTPAPQTRPSSLFQRLIHRARPAPVQPDAPVAQSAAGSVSVPRPAPPSAPAPVQQTRPSDRQEFPPGDGEALSPVTRARMEGLLDVPLRDVRIFRGTVSHRLTQGVQADAATTGNQVHIAAHEGAPATPSGEGLIAHELSHVAARRAVGPALSPEVEETRAQVIEHAVQRRVESAQGVPPAKASAPQLTHRLTPQPVTTPTASRLNVAAPPPSYSASSFSSGLSAGPSAPGAVARAPMDRLPPMPESIGTAYPSGGVSTLMSKENPYEAESQPEEPERDEASLVDRVVEAVLRRLRRESALDRERRGVFRSEIGG